MLKDFDDLFTGLTKTSKAFVCYRSPNENTFKVLIHEHSNTYDNLTHWNQSGFIFAPFDSKQNTFFIPEHLAVKLECQLKKSDIKNCNTNNYNRQKAKYNYLNLVNQTIDYIKSGQAEKIVISRQESGSINPDKIAPIYQQLCQTYPDAFVYLWHHQGTGIWMGATPERLISVTQNRFKTMSLAGTQLYQDVVNWTDKERHEQQVVTDYIIKQLEPISQNLKYSEVFTKKAGPLAHLCTEISGTLSRKHTIKHLVNRLHPTPAVCGTPRDIAQQFILNHEGYNRQFYTGYLGYFNPDSTSDLFVNLRCLSITGNRANLYIGGGITSDSHALREWEETLEKAKVLGGFL